MARIHLPTSKLRARRKRERIVAVFKGVCVAFLAGGAITGVLWLPHVRVSTIEVEGFAGRAAQEIERAAHKHIAGTYMLLFPKDNIFIYPKQSMRERILEEFPWLAEVAVQANNFRTIGIVVRERTPVALWCGENPDARIPCLLMDENGIAYEMAPQFSGTVYTEYFGKAEGVLPKQFLTAGQFRSIKALIQALTEKEGEAVARVAVDEHTDVRATFTNGFTLIFTAAEDSGNVYERYMLAKTAEPFTTHPLGDFEYLDLRFGNRLYYKLR